MRACYHAAWIVVPILSHAELVLLGGKNLLIVRLLCTCVSHPSNARHHTGFDLECIVCACLLHSSRFHHQYSHDDKFLFLLLLFFCFPSTLSLFISTFISIFYQIQWILTFGFKISCLHANAQSQVILSPPSFFLMKINVNVSKVQER